MGKYKHNMVSYRRRLAGATDYEKDDLVLYDYKEPLSPVEDGFGYYGTLTETKDKLFLQCHVCGQLFRNLGFHVRHHNFTAKEYKDHFGLPRKIGLVSEDARRDLSKRMFKTRETTDIEAKRSVAQKAYTDKLVSGEIKYVAEVSTSSLYKQNKAGNCPEQILDHFRKLAEKYGRTPSVSEFKRESGISQRRVEDVYGSWANAVMLAGLQPRKKKDKGEFSLSKETILAGVRNFYVVNGWAPTSGDFQRKLLPGEYRHIKYYFGTMYNMRFEAGVPENKGYKPDGVAMRSVKELTLASKKDIQDE